MSGYRIKRVEHAMKKELSQILREDVKDPRIGFVTITRIDVSRDLRNAKIYYSIIGKESEVKNSEQGLEKAKGFIRKLIGDRLKMKFVPQISFKKDDSIEYGIKLEKMFEDMKIREERKNNE